MVWNYEFIEETIVRESAGCGFANWVYSPHGRPEHERCERLGLTGVITDTPELIIRQR
jgi:hypothetical protein